MLNTTNAIATIAVRNLETARKFYHDTLGLKQVTTEGDEAIVFQSGNSMLNVYRSQFAGTNKATAATWAVADDLEDVVRSLKTKGVTFEHYNLPGMKVEGDVHVGGNVKAAWFKDPDGNILGIMNRH
jgi:catechol 2,3-dioxygenase-like lactoylglutathione lyase family enzyme